MRNIINNIHDVTSSIESFRRDLIKGIVELIETDTYKEYAKNNTLSVSITIKNKDGELASFVVHHIVELLSNEFTAYNLTKISGISSDAISLEDLMKISGSLMGQIEKIPYRGTSVDKLYQEVTKDYIDYSENTLGQFLEGISFPDLTEEEISGLLNDLEMFGNEDTIEVGGYEYGVVQSCLNCGHQFKISEDDVTEDELGVYTVCPECEASFDIEVDISSYAEPF